MAKCVVGLLVHSVQAMNEWHTTHILFHAAAAAANVYKNMYVDNRVYLKFFILQFYYGKRNNKLITEAGLTNKNLYNLFKLL